MDNRFSIKVYEQDKYEDDFNNVCNSATQEWLDERLYEFSKKLGIPEEKIDSIINIENITTDEIIENSLQDYNTKPDVLFFPGGRSPLYAKALEDKGAEKIREYIADGGMYYGICAGAYYAATLLNSYPRYHKRDENGKKTNETYKDEKTIICDEGEKYPLLGIAPFEADGDVEEFYGIGDSKIKEGAFVEVKTDDGETSFVFMPFHLLGPYLKVENKNQVKELATYNGEQLFAGELAGAVSKYFDGHASVVGFHPEMTPTRILRVKKEIKDKTPIMVANEHGRFKRIDEEDIKAVTENCNKFSDNVFLPNLFDKYCDYIKKYFAKDLGLDLKKIEKIQTELQNKINSRPFAEPHPIHTCRTFGLKLDVESLGKPKENNSLLNAIKDEEKKALEEMTKRFTDKKSRFRTYRVRDKLNNPNEEDNYAHPKPPRVPKPTQNENDGR